MKWLRHIVSLAGVCFIFTFLYGQEPCIDTNGFSHNNVGQLSNCDDGTTGCDCNNVCGGSASLDTCNNCKGGNTGFSKEDFEDQCDVCGTGAPGPGPQVQCCDGSLECENNACPFCPDDCPTGTVGMTYYLGIENICVPSLFSTTNSSSQQAFYYYNSVTINGIPVDSDDWVGAFNGEVCVGARKWDTSLCSGVCDVPVIGYDANSLGMTDGYMQTDGIPTFKIYDASEDTYVDAYPSEDIPWVYPKISNLETLIGCSDGSEPDCNGECNGSAIVDICGECGGNGIDEGACDCYGNVEDCDGVCAGATTTDECGVCGGSGIADGKCDCEGHVLDCAGVCAGTAVEDCQDPPECGGSYVIDASGDCTPPLSIFHVSTNPTEFTVAQNYPNPFNSITSIAYSLPENATIELTIYNNHGRKIQSLIQGFQTAGYHSINWNAFNYPSGIYLIRLESGTYSKTQKVVLIK